MSPIKLARHWISKKQTTGDSPPKIFYSDHSLLLFLEKKKGAFGIMKNSNVPKEKVRILFTFTD